MSELYTGREYMNSHFRLVAIIFNIMELPVRRGSTVLYSSIHNSPLEKCIVPKEKYISHKNHITPYLSILDRMSGPLSISARERNFKFDLF